MIRSCPYPECRFTLVGDADAATHFARSHRRPPVIHSVPAHQIERIERCKLCGTIAYFSTGCRHIDLGLRMLGHIQQFHPDKIKGYDPERDRLTEQMKARRN